MDKLDYISRHFSRAEKKRYEHYVVTRIWHELNDLSLKFVTQQYVSRPNGRALTDMYFPQLMTHIEVDEPHHLTQVEQDKRRELDIINATNHSVLNVKISESIESVNERITKVVQLLRMKKDKLTDFEPWDLHKEQDPQTYIDRGYIDVSDDVAFRHSFSAANCFGHNYKGFQRAATKHPNESDTIIWFPKLYPNQGWNNEIKDDENTITEISAIAEKAEEHIDWILSNSQVARIVFARVKSPLGDVMYRFKGKYELNKSKSNYQNGLIWNRTSERVSTYDSDQKKAQHDI